MRNRNRFELALERLQPTDWSIFENLASEFLASEFHNLRTVANLSGDGGRDSELFSPESDPTTLFQYSVSQSWETKIGATANRINQTFPKAIMLVYVTNQQIGAKADELKKKIRARNRLILDVRDKSWFLERMNTSEQRMAVAERLAELFVDTLLKDRQIIDDTSQVLTDNETRAAYLYLTLQLEDETREKGLTKLSFEAIVRSVLRETDSDNRMSRDNIRKQVREILPSHPPKKIDAYTDGALNRMKKKYIRYWQAEDEFCLTYEERVRLSERVAELDLESASLSNAVEQLLQIRLEGESGIPDNILPTLILQVRRIIQKYFNTRGEKFATAVTTGKLPDIAKEDVKTIVATDLAQNPIKAPFDVFDLLLGTTADLLCFPSPIIVSYLRAIADSYTLMAFLRETPDVQSSVKKMFSHGEIWLDTSIVLPIFAEKLLEDESIRQYTNMLASAQIAGLKFRITKGIVEEVNGHMNRSLACARTRGSEWQGSIPFLFSVYVMSGRSVDGFPTWIETFKGDVKSEDDLADYLLEFHDIETGSLEDYCNKANIELRGAVQEIWHETHVQRKNFWGYEIDDSVMHKLVRHDVENYLGVIFKRSAEVVSPLGYSTWWLTLDSTAHKLHILLQSRENITVPSSPVLSLDFLANYLTFGPLRRYQLRSDYELPLCTDRTFTDYIPPELLEIAKQSRESAEGLPEHVIRRKVRDELDTAKRRIGKHVIGGTTVIQNNIEKAILDAPLEV